MLTFTENIQNISLFSLKNPDNTIRAKYRTPLASSVQLVLYFSHKIEFARNIWTAWLVRQSGWSLVPPTVSVILLFTSRVFFLILSISHLSRASSEQNRSDSSPEDCRGQYLTKCHNGALQFSNSAVNPLQLSLPLSHLQASLRLTLDTKITSYEGGLKSFYRPTLASAQPDWREESVVPPPVFPSEISGCSQHRLGTDLTVPMCSRSVV